MAPEMIFSKVLFPEPLEPTIPTTCPGNTSKDTSDKAFRVRRECCRVRTRIRYSFRLSEDSLGIRNSMLTFLTEITG